MQTETSIYIPKPCHENWNKMTPTQQGKFCGSCSKQVVDFSLMSDQQILNFLSHQSGKLCGRFDAEQLQRPLIATKIKKKKSWWMALAMPLLFWFGRSDAQKNLPKQKHNTIRTIARDNILVGDLAVKIVNDTIKPSENSGLSEQIIGKVAICQPPKQITITGRVLDTDDKPIAYATIMQKGTRHGTVSDSSGDFSININTGEDSITLVTSFVGFETIEKRIKVSENNVAIKMNMQPVIAGEVVVVGYISKNYHRTAGLMSIIRRITTFQKIDSSFKKAIGISNVFPNPVLKGNSFHVKIKNAGDYQIQLLDNQSRLIQVEEINIVSNNSTKQIQLSSSITSGIYYLRLINEQTKKSYTEKLIIQ